MSVMAAMETRYGQQDQRIQRSAVIVIMLRDGRTGMRSRQRNMKFRGVPRHREPISVPGGAPRRVFRRVLIGHVGAPT